MTFIADLQNDEIRDGFLVMADRKKVWNRQLEIWQEIDRICRKHKIKYHAMYGTLLGAVRHKGFIPWDDDMDIGMLRPEYNRFYEIVDEELKGGLFEVRTKTSSALTVAHSQTTALIRSDFTNKQGSKGLVVDVFALDIAPDGTKDAYFAVNAINELMGTIYNFPALVEHANKGRRTLNDWSVIEGLHAMQDRAKQFEFLNTFAEGLFDWSKAVNTKRFICRSSRRSCLRPQLTTKSLRLFTATGANSFGTGAKSSVSFTARTSPTKNFCNAPIWISCCRNQNSSPPLPMQRKEMINRG